jgi:hypothetical protein
MQARKAMRRELWEYLKKEGIEITPRQHETIKDIVEKYIFEAAELTKSEYKNAMGELEVRRAGYNEWRKERAKRNIEKAKRKRENKEKKALQTETICVRETKPVSPNTHDSKKAIPPKSYLRDV